MIIDIHQVRQLIQKYNVSAPRYTSYPTAPQFRPVEDPRLLQQTVQTERRREPANYSIYFHLPFCRSLCWYCGCTKVITRQQGAEIGRASCRERVKYWIGAVCKEIKDRDER